MLIGAVAELHAACYGAYKDSPYEKFFTGTIYQRDTYRINSILHPLKVYKYPPF